jgi:uncharacterized protein with PIN domain
MGEANRLIDNRISDSDDKKVIQTATQIIKCVRCNAEIGTLKTATGTVKSNVPEQADFKLNSFEYIDCPQCGQRNKIY